MAINTTIAEKRMRFESACRLAVRAGKPLRDFLRDTIDEITEANLSGRVVSSTMGGGFSVTFAPGRSDSDTLVAYNELLAIAADYPTAADDTALAALILADDRLQVVTEFRTDRSTP